MNNTVSRRWVLGVGLFLATGTAVLVISQNYAISSSAEKIDPVVAHKRAVSGEIILLDIRRPDEWALTGSGEGAHRLDMRRDDFIAVLDDIVKGDRAKPVAVICARGVRSRRMIAKLQDAGFTHIIDVPEGMLGSSAGPGWIKRGLPVVKE